VDALCSSVEAWELSPVSSIQAVVSLDKLSHWHHG